LNRLSYAIPPTLISLCIIIGLVLFRFWDTHESKFYIVQLALPILCGLAILYLLSFIFTGQALFDKNSQLVTRVFFSAVVFSGVIAFVLFTVFLFMPGAPVGEVGTKPPLNEIARGIFLDVFLPVGISHLAGGIVQLVLIQKYTV